MRSRLFVLSLLVGCTHARADPPPAVRVFTPAGTVKFTNAAKVPTQKLLVKQSKYGALSPDGKTWVTGVGQTSTLITTAQPKGIPFKADSLWYARFSPDQTRIAMGQFLGPETVVSAVDAKTVWTRTSPNNKACEIRFASNDELVLQEESKDESAQLVRIDLKTGKETRLGAPHRVAYCTGSPDGKTFLTYNEYNSKKDAKGSFYNGGVVHRVDGPSGALTVFATDVGSSYALSPVADRVCFAPEKKHVVRCVRTDGIQETVLQGIEDAGLMIDDAGKRMLVTTSREVKTSGSYVTVYYLIDFAAGTSRELVGVTGSSGGTMHILDEGKLIAGGSANGIHIWDVDDGKKYFAARTPFYAVVALPGHPRKLIGGAEPPGGGALEDLYGIEVP